jgi:hypothetical protein
MRGSCFREHVGQGAGEFRVVGAAGVPDTSRFDDTLDSNARFTVAQLDRAERGASNHVPS